MSILRKLTIAILMAFGLSLLAVGPAAAAGVDPKDKQGDIKVCKVLKDADIKKNDRVTFSFVIREKGSQNEKEKFDLVFKKGDEGKKMCAKREVGKGAYIVREKVVAKGYELKNIDVKGCYYKDRNDKDARVEVNVQNKDKCTVTFTNKKKH
jgi:hypothetical protein